MKSKLIEETELALIRSTQRLSPEDRLNAFLTHTRLMMELYEMGRDLRVSDQPGLS